MSWLSSQVALPREYDKRSKKLSFGVIGLHHPKEGVSLFGLLTVATSFLSQWVGFLLCSALFLCRLLAGHAV